MLLSNGTQVTLKAKTTGPASEPPVPAEQTTNSERSAHVDPRAAERQPEPEEEVLLSSR